jgi:hypothetical protein
MKLNFLDRFFKKYSDIKFRKNLSSGSRVVPCGQTDGQTDVMKLTVAFCNFANMPEIESLDSRHSVDEGILYSSTHSVIMNSKECL